MGGLIDLLAILAPETQQILDSRYRILCEIKEYQPIGRRLLADKLSFSESKLRNEINFLKKNHLIEASYTGMVLTDLGQETIQEFEKIFSKKSNLQKKAQELTELFEDKTCYIVPQEEVDQSNLLDALGKRTVSLLDEQLPHGDNVIAVMGGTTMAAIANNMTPALSENRDLLFVPGRGSFGESVQVQSNTLAATMAANTAGTHQVLYTPDHVSKETYPYLIQEPTISKTLSKLKEANCVLLGIGRVDDMANRRQLNPESIKLLDQEEAVGESLGEFYNSEGHTVLKVPRIGLNKKGLYRIPIVVAVAGGAEKAEAIKAFMRTAPSQTRLVLDEGAANKILMG